MRTRSVFLWAAWTVGASASATAQMAHPPGMSHAQVIEVASAGAPDFISGAAAIAWIDGKGTVHQMRPGTNGFTCAIIVPDPLDGPVCGDANAIAWFTALLRQDAKPPVLSAPGMAYMARGGSHYEDAAGNLLMEHDQSPHAAGSRRVREPPHWMLMWPLDPAATGFPLKPNGSGSYIMFAGTPWAHLMVYQDPAQMTAPPRP